MTNQTSSMLRVEKVWKSFGGRAVLRAVELDVRTHEVVVLIGASGSGKSTLLRCINGLEPVDAGAIWLKGDVDVTALGADLDQVRRRVGIVFQSFNLFPHLTVLQNITLAPRKVLGMSSEQANAKAVALLDRFGLAGKAQQYPDLLSGGQAQRVAIIRALAMDPEVMLEKNITMDDINFTLSNSFGNEITCVYSDYNADKLIFRIRLTNVLDNIKNKQRKIKINPLDQSDQIYLLKNFQDQMLNNVVLRGIKGINKVILRKIKDNVIETAGSFKKQEIWVLDCIGTNMLDVLALDYVDGTRTCSNHIIEIYETLGIEAARQSIYNELSEVLDFDGAYINYHHLCLLCDRMTYTNKLISIFRHGINNDNIGPIAKASFEETPEMFLKAARHAELDIMRGISANVMCGQEGFYGTSAFQVVLDIEKMKQLQAANVTLVNQEDELSTLFSDIDLAAQDSCSHAALTITNNVVNIKPSDLGEDNDYNPGF